MKRQKKRPANEPTESGALSRHDWLLGFFLVAATIMAYQPVWHAGLIWDDDGHVTPPGLRSLNGLIRIWTQPGASQQYYPLVHSVFWVEHKIWGDATAGYHWVNILLHAFSALLLVKILRQLQIPGAWLAAALFALHPVEVESVAWITELKNTLSGVFYLGAALAYLEFDRNRSGGKYAMALGLFLLGLMSKSVIATLPAALLVVFWWQRGKLSWKRDVLPLVPFFIAGIGAGLFTAWVERKFIIGAKGAEYNFSIIERCLIAGRDIWFYLGKLIWPVDLTFIYPRWNVSQAVWWQYLFPAAALLLLGVLVWRRWRGPLAGLLFFVGTLFPALGFFNVYPFRFSFVADHFQYLASLGPIVLTAAGITALPGFFQKRKTFLEPLLCAALLLVLGTLTWKQCGMYVNIETLWQTTLRQNPDCWMARSNLGVALEQKGKADEAIADYQAALQIKPDYLEAHYNLGNSLLQKGRVDEAIAQYQAALQIKPDYAQAHNNLGNALLQNGKTDEAIAQYQAALQIKPDYAEAHNNLGHVLRQKGKTDEAIAHFQKALEIKPDYAEADYNLGGALGQEGRTDEAIAQYQKALEIKPDFAEAHHNLGNVLLQKGRTDEAIAHYQKALQFAPDNPIIQNSLAWLLATGAEASLRNGNKAVELAQQANTLTGKENPMILHTLAAAFAETGRFPEAVETAQRALHLAETQSNTKLAAQLQAQLKLYQAGMPFHSPESTH